MSEALNLMHNLRQALLSGDLAALARLEQALTAIHSTAPADPDESAELRRLAEGNQSLLRAAGRGLRATQRRLAEIARAEQGLATYDPRGRTDPPRRTKGLHKRF